MIFFFFFSILNKKHYHKTFISFIFVHGGGNYCGIFENKTKNMSTSSSSATLRMVMKIYRFKKTNKQDIYIYICTNISISAYIVYLSLFSKAKKQANQNYNKYRKTIKKIIYLGKLIIMCYILYILKVNICHLFKAWLN